MPNTAMTARAAAIMEQPGSWRIVDVEPGEPRTGEVLVRFKAAGLCHSDAHAASGAMPVSKLPLIGGHEGAGVVEEVGPGVDRLAPGDRVAAQFVPSCGRCPNCRRGRMNMCDLAMLGLAGSMADGTYRARVDGREAGQMTMLGTFAERAVVPQYSLVPIPDGVSFEAAALVSCGVLTGWGSAVNAAGVGAGDTVIVMGTGGVGMNALQGAAARGAAHVIAVDPVPFKREAAREFGATAAFGTMAEAADHARLATGGQGADSAIVCVGNLDPGHVAEAVAAIGRGSTVVVTGIGDASEVGVPISLWELAMTEKRIQGTLYGTHTPGDGIPRLLEMYKAGRLKLDELITRRYKLEEIGAAYEDLHAGRIIRGVVLHGGEDGAS